VSCTLDMDECTLSFAVNGEDQGIAYRAADGIGSCPLVPAVCLGSTDGGKSARVSVLLPTITPIRRFDRLACNPKIRVTDAGRRCARRWWLPVALTLCMSARAQMCKCVTCS